MMDIIEKFTFKKPGEVRTRFAPSPTGFFHIGSARTALFNYLFTKKNQGTFILRIEDTDKERSKPEFEKDILENLELLGIKWDEGPYRQSERKSTYLKYLEKLLEEKKAYHCFCSPEELEARRQEQMSRGLAPKYSGKCSSLSSKEVKENLAQGKKYIIRFKTPIKKVSFNDLVRGKVEFDTDLIGDFSIAKDLNTPLYNFAVVIDDYEMKISHLIRGEDLLPNTPKQIVLQEALGFSKIKYAHLPLILGSDRSKMSKRHGAVSVREYLDQGYLSEALINFLAFLGWNPGTEREIFSLSSLIKEFSIEKVQKSGAIFNIKKLDFINAFYIRQKPLDRLTELCIPYLIKAGSIYPVLKSEQYPPAYGGMMISHSYKINEEEISFSYLENIIDLYQDRIVKLSEVVELTDFFFKDKLDYDKGLLKWKDMSNQEVNNVINRLIDVLSKMKQGDWNRKNLEKILILEAEKTGDRGKLLWPLRAALSGKKASAGPFEIGEVLGKEKTLVRLKQALS
jgi:glutamyl-tRNA synthetase